jgi:Flp pilus assembly pilin Flp
MQWRFAVNDQCLLKDSKKRKARSLLRSQKGQGLIEYLIIVSLIAIATMAIMRVMSQTVQAKFAKVTQVLQGNDNSVDIRVESIQEQHFKKKDMSDFFYGTRAADDRQ